MGKLFFGLIAFIIAACGVIFYAGLWIAAVYAIGSVAVSGLKMGKEICHKELIVDKYLKTDLFCEVKKKGRK